MQGLELRKGARFKFTVVLHTLELGKAESGPFDLVWKQEKHVEQSKPHSSTGSSVSFGDERLSMVLSLDKGEKTKLPTKFQVRTLGKKEPSKKGKVELDLMNFVGKDSHESKEFVLKKSSNCTLKVTIICQDEASVRPTSISPRTRDAERSAKAHSDRKDSSTHSASVVSSPSKDEVRASRKEREREKEETSKDRSRDTKGSSSDREKRVQELKQANRKLEKANRDLSRDVKKAQERLEQERNLNKSSSNEAMSILKKDKQALQHENLEQHKELLVMKEKLSKAEATLAAAGHSSSDQASLIGDLQSQVDSLTKKMLQAETDVRDERSSTTKLKQDLTSSKESLQRTNQELESKLKHTQSLVEREKRRVTNVEDGEQLLKNELEHLRKELDAHRKSVKKAAEAAQEEDNNLSMKLTQALTMREHLDSQVSKLKADVSTLEQHLSSERSRHESTREELKEHRTEAVQLREEIRELRDAKESLSRAVQDMTSRREAWKADLQRDLTSRDSTIRELKSQLAHVNSKLGNSEQQLSMVRDEAALTESVLRKEVLSAKESSLSRNVATDLTTISSAAYFEHLFQSDAESMSNTERMLESLIEEIRAF